jgi:hypothetical protein
LTAVSAVTTSANREVSSEHHEKLSRNLTLKNLTLIEIILLIFILPIDGFLELLRLAAALGVAKS